MKYKLLVLSQPYAGAITHPGSSSTSHPSLPRREGSRSLLLGGELKKLRHFIVDTTLVSFFIILQGAGLHAQPVEKIIHAGNEFYRQKQYEQAEQQYRKAITIDPANKTAQFNLANALYKKNKQEEAKVLYDKLSTKEKKVNDRARSFYNKGVVLSAQKKPEESIEAYKQALRSNPDDKEARENLQKALLELKKKNPPKKKEEQKKQQKPQSQSKMSQKEATQKLKLLEQKEKEIQQRLQKEKAKGGISQPKDW